MLQIRSYEELESYVESGDKEHAIFIPYSPKFVILKYHELVEELENVIYIWDIIQNVESDTVIHTHEPYSKDSMFQSDVKLQPDGTVKQHSMIVGQATYNALGIEALAYDNTSFIHDPRGFMSSIITTQSNVHTIQIRDYYGKQILVIVGATCYDLSTGRVMTYDDFIEETILSLK